MPVVSAFLVPGSPLPLLKPDNLPWGRLAAAYQRAGRALAASRPDAVLLYSTQWYAVLDEQWLTRRKSAGVHVDDNWHEHGEMKFDIASDTELAHACVAASARIGVHARGVNYDGFPIDSGTISACALMGIGTSALPLVAASNNLYHSPEQTEKLGALAAACADDQGKRVAVVGVGELSSVAFSDQIELGADRISDPEHDKWNQRVLQLIESGDVPQLRRVLPDFAKEARADMGFKHFYWILGALQGRFAGARVHGYGPLYGSGGAVVEFTL
ncbi:tRNA U-34 5-methylaminomethyl-2-thiouridine biosynthesis protein [Methylibium sp.]|uniref:DODA-type extradiol aromatic ring-opening family dioxygenase n=1 Tax=Methylibium sp. TaxID=2067992 RepID=UPI003D0E2597